MTEALAVTMTVALLRTLSQRHSSMPVLDSRLTEGVQYAFLLLEAAKF